MIDWCSFFLGFGCLYALIGLVNTLMFLSIFGCELDRTNYLTFILEAFLQAALWPWIFYRRN